MMGWLSASKTSGGEAGEVGGLETTGCIRCIGLTRISAKVYENHLKGLTMTQHKKLESHSGFTSSIIPQPVPASPGRAEPTPRLPRTLLILGRAYHALCNQFRFSLCLQTYCGLTVTILAQQNADVPLAAEQRPGKGSGKP